MVAKVAHIISSTTWKKQCIISGHQICVIPKNLPVTERVRPLWRTVHTPTSFSEGLLGKGKPLDSESSLLRP